METTIIPKEEISKYHCIAADENKSEFWLNQLKYAERLGNQFKGKTEITFQTSDGPKKVETTIWSLMKDYIQLKGGINIPLKSLIDVTF